MPERYDAVLLDLYDTIVWSEWFRMRDAIAGPDRRSRMEADRLQEAFEQTRPARGVGEFGSVEGDMAAVLEAAGVRTTPRSSTSCVELERAHLERGIDLYDDVLPALTSLRDRGVQTALVSNCSISTRPVVERLGLGEVFEPGRAVVRGARDEAGSGDLPGGARPSSATSPPGRAVFVDDQTDVLRRRVGRRPRYAVDRPTRCGPTRTCPPNSAAVTRS